ncbi:MAG: insulinase family protein [Clostridia bacterium]|nr:insulinase family protein [Clostridia bacterium]
MIKKYIYNTKLELIYEKSRVPMDTIVVVCKTGSMSENDNNRGIAHFLEHTTFKGTEKRTYLDISKEIDETGAHSNAFTSRDMTAFYISGLEKYGEKYLDILSDMLFNSKFDKEEIEKEKGVVLEEARADFDNADELAEMLFFKNSLPKEDPLAHPIIGYEDTILKYNREMLIEFKEKFYHPENMIIGFSTNRSFDEAKNLIDIYFNKIFEKKIYKYDFYKNKIIKRKFKYGYNYLNKDFEQSAILIAIPWIPQDNKNETICRVVEYVLGGGSSSKLFVNVREKNGLAYDIGVFPSVSKNYGLLFVLIDTVNSKAAKAVKCVKETFVDLINTGITQKELDSYINQNEFAQIKVELDPYSKLMFIVRKYARTGKIVNIKNSMKKIRSIKLDDVNNFIRNKIDLKKVSITYVGREIKENLVEVFKNS